MKSRHRVPKNQPYATSRIRARKLRKELVAKFGPSGIFWMDIARYAVHVHMFGYPTLYLEVLPERPRRY